MTFKQPNRRPTNRITQVSCGHTIKKGKGGSPFANIMEFGLYRGIRPDNKVTEEVTNARLGRWLHGLGV